MEYFVTLMKSAYKHAQGKRLIMFWITVSITPCMELCQTKTNPNGRRKIDDEEQWEEEGKEE